VSAHIIVLSIYHVTKLKVWVNQYNMLNNNVQFGGKKQSGIGAFRIPDPISFTDHDFVAYHAGRELGSYALEEYTSVKALYWNFVETLQGPL
jgi:aldehyde dehydrogenase (NAD+)